MIGLDSKYLNIVQDKDKTYITYAGGTIATISWNFDLGNSTSLKPLIELGIAEQIIKALQETHK